MKQRILWAAIAVNALALIGLLLYSLERSIWAFGLYEQMRAPAVAAAAVVEISAVALIISSGALELLDKAARAWSNRALGAILAVQTLANLSAGYLRGGRAALAQFGSADNPAAYAVGAVLWLVVNMAVPVLILSLSKLLERLIAALTAEPTNHAAPETMDAFNVLPPAPAVVWARPASVETFVQSDGVTTQSSQTTLEEMLPETFAEPARDRQCKYCGAAGLTAVEVARHGRARKRSGACPTA